MHFFLAQFYSEGIGWTQQDNVLNLQYFLIDPIPHVLINL